jgi:cytochrome c oxidase subunit 1
MNETYPAHGLTLGSEATDTYLSVARTVRSWLLTRDHKRIGVMFLVLNGIALGIGGVLALCMRAELIEPRGWLMSSMTYNRFFTLHGVIMVWLFMIPSIPSAFGNFMLPLMVGARDVAFPRLNLASVYIYLLGAVVTIGGLVAGGADTGWTFYVPYSARDAVSVIPVLLGVFIIGWSTILTGLNFIVTVHRMRAEGLQWMRMPLFVWTIYGTSIIQVLATPVLAMTLLIVGMDHAFDWGVFDPTRGGDPLLYQHIFWFYSHPAVYIMILPGMGVISECVCTFSRKNPLSYDAIVWATVGIALVGFLTWGHHMFAAGISVFDAGAFGILSMFVAIFSAIKVFTWTGTLYKGSISLKTPLLYVFAFMFLFVFGGMTGVAVASMSLDIHWHDTYFVVAHFHFIMVGGTITAYLAAIHYWFPKMTGRMYPERLGVLSAVGVFGGFMLTFVPHFLLGNMGMPRRYHNYPEAMQPLHVLSTAGAFVLGSALFVTLAYLLWATKYGPVAGPNPWASASFEWRTTSPPPLHNFEGVPPFERGPYDYTKEAIEKERAQHG